MKTSIEKILANVYEIEGLLLVMDKHGDETPAIVYDRLRQKTATLGEMVQLMELPEKEEPQLSPAMPAQPQAPALPGDEYDAEETWQHDNGEEFKEVFSIDYQEPAREEMVDNRPPDEDITLEWIHEEEDAKPSVQEDDEPQDGDFVFVTREQPAQQGGDGMRVDEKLQRTLSKDLRKAFSLNDRFRFRRELFSNSDVDMNEALNMIEAMRSYDEAQEYFIDNLGWDADNAEVADFMAIVRNHFA
ncbi:MAG: hypothetical protein IJ808_00625 [Muribaculaceae bacterium]|nr:hypothetical protein [Muribaculaceae bacterium]